MSKMQIQAMVNGYLPISCAASSGGVTLFDLTLVPEATPDGILLQGIESGNYTSHIIPRHYYG